MKFASAVTLSVLTSLLSQCFALPLTRQSYDHAPRLFPDRWLRKPSNLADANTVLSHATANSIVARDRVPDRPLGLPGKYDASLRRPNGSIALGTKQNEPVEARGLSEGRDDEKDALRARRVEVVNCPYAWWQRLFMEWLLSKNKDIHQATCGKFEPIITPITDPKVEPAFHVKVPPAETPSDTNEKTPSDERPGLHVETPPEAESFDTDEDVPLENGPHAYHVEIPPE